MKIANFKLAAGGVLLCLGSGATHAATAPTCTVTFGKETPITATLSERQNGSSLLVAESQEWTKEAGMRVEIEYLVSDGKRIPVTAYLRHTSIGEVTAGGNAIQMPKIETLRRRYWFDPSEGLQVNGADNEPIASIKCDKP